MSGVFFTSDLHLGHAKLLSFRSERYKKLFPTVEHWNEFIVKQWNSRIGKKSIVWVLGDVNWGDDVLKLFHELNGRKRLVLGNHDDHDMRKYLPYFERIAGVTKKYDLVMSHVPIHPQELCFRWTTNVHGHIHHIERNLQAPEYINVNVDVRGGLPVSLEEIRKEIEDAKEKEESTTIQT